jgi:hypothetical protein
MFYWLMADVSVRFLSSKVYRLLLLLHLVVMPTRLSAFEL